MQQINVVYIHSQVNTVWNYLIFENVFLFASQLVQLVGFYPLSHQLEVGIVFLPELLDQTRVLLLHVFKRLARHFHLVQQRLLLLPAHTLDTLQLVKLTLFNTKQGCWYLQPNKKWQDFFSGVRKMLNNHQWLDKFGDFFAKKHKIQSCKLKYFQYKLPTKEIGLSFNWNYLNFIN